PIGVPGAFEDAIAQILCRFAPGFGPAVESEHRGDLGQSVTGRPAEHSRMSVDARTGAEFPKAGVRLEGKRLGFLAELFQPLEKRDVALPRQAPVKKHLR